MRGSDHPDSQESPKWHAAGGEVDGGEQWPLPTCPAPKAHDPIPTGARTACKGPPAATVEAGAADGRWHPCCQTRSSCPSSSYITFSA